MEHQSSLNNEVTTMRLELAELKRQLAANQTVEPSTERSTRRGMLRLAGVAAVGGAATLLHSSPAAAATGNMQYGAANDATIATTSLDSSSAIRTLLVKNSAAGEAMKGSSTGEGTGLHGEVLAPGELGFGVWGFSQGSKGFGLVGSGGAAQLYLEPRAGVTGPASATLHRTGAVCYTAGTFWVCVEAGTPGVWRSIGAKASAGSLYPISPTRVYDSRRPTSNPLASGLTRNLVISNKIDNVTGGIIQSNVVPAGATAIAYNLTVVNTVGSGFLAVNEGGNTTVSASSINWTTSNQTLANGSMVKLSSTRSVTVICGGSSSSTDYIIDVVGYYL